MNVFIVIPTIRNVEFLKDWASEFRDCSIIVVEDRAEKTVEVPKIKCLSISHYSHQDIKKEFGNDDWIFPWKSAAVRSYGFYKAYQAGAEVVITLDDDCFPYTKNFVQTHLENLSLKLPEAWYPTYPYRKYLYTRGFPYLVRNQHPVGLSHGIWSEVPDFDGITQLVNYDLRVEVLPALTNIIPAGFFFPMSSMNLAFRREVIPLMYQLLMGYDEEGKSWGYDRFDDIWSGIFAKKVLDHLGMGVVSGSPAVRHARASNAFTNLKKEATGVEKNELLWQQVKQVKLVETTPVAAYQELVRKVKFPDEEYFAKLKKAMQIWAKLFT